MVPTTYGETHALAAAFLCSSYYNREREFLVLLKGKREAGMAQILRNNILLSYPLKLLNKTSPSFLPMGHLFEALSTELCSRALLSAPKVFEGTLA